LALSEHHTSDGSARPGGEATQRDVFPRTFAPSRLEHADLNICPTCASELVYPLDWAPVDMCRWRLELRCPDCESEWAGVYEQAILDRFDEILDAGTDSLLADLHRLQRSNMEEELERFNLALSDDLILPEDF